MKSKVLSIFIALIFLIVIFSPFSVFALVRSGEGEAVLLQEGEFDLITSDEVKQFGSAAVQLSAEEYVHTQLLTYPDSTSLNFSINVTSYNIPLDSVVAFYSNVINDNPDLFFVSSSLSYNYYTSTGNIAYIFPEFSMDKEEVAAAVEVFNEGAQKALSSVDSTMTDLQKALVLHDCICDLAYYPQVDLSTQDKSIYHSAYGLFYNGEAVCAGYSLAYSYLLNQAGVPCEYVASDDMQHAWNKVKIGDNWYNVDCTWDDLDFSNDFTIHGSMGHYCFLKSDEKFNTLDCLYHYGGYTYDTCTAGDTTYDTAFWDDVVARIYVVDGDYYYIDPNTSTHYSNLVKRTVSDTETTVKQIYYSVSLSSYIGCTDSSGNTYNKTIVNPLVRLVWLDNRFYIVYQKKICSVTTDSRTCDIISINNYCLGFGVNENHNLIYQYYSSPETENELDKLTYYNNYFTTVKGTNYNNYPDINYDGVINAKDYAMIIKA